MGEKIRAFIAIELSEGMRDELSALQERLKPFGNGIKWVEPRNIHVTLRFLGDTALSDLPSVENAACEAASRHKPFEITVEGIGAFPGFSSPKVIWAGLKNGAEESVRLYSSLSDSLSAIGIPPESRPFSPHITIGRVKDGGIKDGFKHAAGSCAFKPDRVTAVSEIVLFRSVLSTGGPVYTPISKAKLSRS